VFSAVVQQFLRSDQIKYQFSQEKNLPLPLLIPERMLLQAANRQV
jgi:hypothetical protein